MVRQLIFCALLFGSISIGIYQEQKIDSNDLLKLRNLQYEQAKRVIRMQDLKSEFEKVNSENEVIKVEIDNWVKDQAKKQNVDLTKYYFDSDKLKFVENKKND